MLNNPTITTTELGAPESTIFANMLNHQDIGCRVAAAAANGTDSQGRAIARAGTPLVGTFENRINNPMTAAGADLPTGVLVHDVPLWNGDANGSLCIMGVIDENKIHPDIVTLLKATPIPEGTHSIKMITGGA